MEPVGFVTNPEYRLVGVQRRIRLDTADWTALWNGEYAPRMADVEASGEGDACLGCYFSTGETALVDFVMGKPARADAHPAEGLVLRDVPAANYAVFECSMSEIARTWRAIYSEWFPGSGLMEDESAPCIEQFRPGCHEGSVPVRIFVPVIIPEA
ncbi:MAG: hypothetical protein GX446_09390 [Chthonomonadales bacterium]|nr:hypothetical protein [Chthonomonadales bacterium]